MSLDRRVTKIEERSEAAKEIPQRWGPPRYGEEPTEGGFHTWEPTPRESEPVTNHATQNEPTQTP